VGIDHAPIWSYFVFHCKANDTEHTADYSLSNQNVKNGANAALTFDPLATRFNISPCATVQLLADTERMRFVSS
jgi:hypothetical protein